MIYTEAVDYIHSLLKFGIRPGLSGMDALLRLLGNPHNELKFVHVAGTNGKGSTSTAISNVMIDAGYKVGLYTSPYVSEFLERVQFCGKPVCKDTFARSVEKVKSAVESLQSEGVTITEFEALTAAAFLCFKELRCDVVVLEVGLGGRLDATNVIGTPLVNVITSLSIDHASILGDTIEEIAFEKCGTIKNGSKVVCSFGQPDGALSVVDDTCRKNNCTLVIPDKNDIKTVKSDLFGTDFLYKGKEYSTSLSGLHQLKNMTCVIEACSILSQNFIVTYENVFRGIKATTLPARVEVLSQKPLVVLDGGHNEDGAKAFFDVIKGYLQDETRVIVMAGMMADKNVEESLRNLMGSCAIFVSVTPENPRAMSCFELSAIAEKYCSMVKAFPKAREGIDYCFNELTEDKILLVVGSLYLAGEVREHIIELVNLQFNN